MNNILKEIVGYTKFRIDEEKMKIQCAIKHFEAIGFERYIAPVKNLNSFKNKANIS